MTQQDLLLFLNIPFCPRQCAHCARAVHPLNTLDALPGYIAALRKEVQAFAPDAEGRTVAGVWVGGGIAGHLFDEELGDLLQDMRRWYTFAPDAEVTLKVHPGMVSVETLNACRRGKVDRLSIEYATGDPFESEALERFLPPVVMDTTAMILNSDHRLRRSFDVLVGAPGQTAATLTKTLESVHKYGAGHVVLYPFRMEVGARYPARHRQNEQVEQASLRRHLPDAAEAAALRETAAAWLAAHDFHEYRPDHFALSGQESRFLQLEAAGCEQVGFGAGAETRMDGIYSRNTADLERYVRLSPDPQAITAVVKPLG
jgi:oxygen-independent coproporphyrinogen-3 oxidase